MKNPDLVPASCVSVPVCVSVCMCVSMLFVYVVYVMESLLSVFHMSGGLQDTDTHVTGEEVLEDTGWFWDVCVGGIFWIWWGGGGVHLTEK